MAPENMYTFIKYLYYRLLDKKKERYIQSLVRRGLVLGRNVDIIDTFFFDPSHCFLISIGDNSTICPNVRLIAHDASTKKYLGYTKIGRINILSNCFIGDSVIVLPGVTIGPNTIVGAGALVNKDIPPNTVAAGYPAKVISTLDEYIEKIRKISASKKIFDEEYYIDKLDDKRRKEIIDSIGDTIGFII